MTTFYNESRERQRALRDPSTNLGITSKMLASMGVEPKEICGTPEYMAAQGASEAAQQPRVAADAPQVGGLALPSSVERQV